MNKLMTMGDPNTFGKFMNVPDGYAMHKLRDDSWGWFWSVPVYRVDIIEPTPLLWQAPDGHQEKCVPVFESDDCSTPPLMWNMPGLNPDRFLLSGLHHDCICKYGGLFVRAIGETDFHFQRMTRLDGDNRLRLWVGAEGGNAAQRWEYFRGVRIGAMYQKFPEIGYWDAIPVQSRMSPCIDKHNAGGILKSAV